MTATSSRLVPCLLLNIGIAIIKINIDWDPEMGPGDPCTLVERPHTLVERPHTASWAGLQYRLQAAPTEAWITSSTDF
jgi:hypothetical protein